LNRFGVKKFCRFLPLMVWANRLKPMLLLFASAS